MRYALGKINHILCDNCNSPYPEAKAKKEYGKAFCDGDCADTYFRRNAEQGEFGFSIRHVNGHNPMRRQK